MTTFIGIVVLVFALIGLVTMRRGFGRAQPLNKFSIVFIAGIVLIALYYSQR